MNETWFAVHVSDRTTGIAAVHYQRAMHPSTAKEREEEAGFLVDRVEVHGTNVRWPRLPNYIGRRLV